MNKDFLNNPEKAKWRLHMKELLSGLVLKLGCPISEMLGWQVFQNWVVRHFAILVCIQWLPLEVGSLSKLKMFHTHLQKPEGTRILIVTHYMESAIDSIFVVKVCSKFLNWEYFLFRVFQVGISQLAPTAHTHETGGLTFGPWVPMPRGPEGPGGPLTPCSPWKDVTDNKLPIKNTYNT